MKTFLNRIAIGFLICTLTSSAAFAKGKKESVKFPVNMKVNGTLIPKGTYDVKFDEDKGELSIIKDNKLIARTSATVEKRVRKAHDYLLHSAGTGDDIQFTGITFSGSDRNVLVSSTAASNH
jgi:hypothetical protein